MHFKFTTLLAIVSVSNMAGSALAQINIPAELSVRAPLTTNGGSLRGEYWKLPPKSVPLDGATNPTNRIDKVISTFGAPNGTFTATRFVYLGNDLSHVTNWLGADAKSFAGQTNNLDDGAFRLTGFINVTNAGTLNLGTTSDDGSRVTIGGIDVINNDSSHGDATVDTNVVFSAAGVYPIEVTYFNGDWTDAGNEGSPDPSLHGGANFHLRLGGADVTTNQSGIFFADVGVVVVPATASVGAPLTTAGGGLTGEYWKRPPVGIALDGATNPKNRIDEQIARFGPPNGTFTATKMVYLGNDLTPVMEWLSDDTNSFTGFADNLDDGAFRFSGFINVTNAGASVNLGTTSDDGSRVIIGGVDVINNDSSHGDATVDNNVVFSAAGLYPIEVTYFNGDWTDAANVGSPDPSLHGGANFHLRVAGADVTPSGMAMFHPLTTPPPATVPPQLLDFEFNEGQGTNTTDSAAKLVGVLGFGMTTDPKNLPVTVTNSPAGKAGDRALSLNAGSATNQSALAVNDVYYPILAFATNAPFTMEAWINREASDKRTYEGIGAYGRSYKLGLNNGQLQFTLYGLVDINSGLVVPTGAWHHVAAVWQPGTGVEFFLDGTSVTNIAETRVPRAYQNSVLTIGAENVGTNAMQNTFQGMIDRFRIHSAALTSAELDSVAATPAAVLPSTVVAYNFNEANAPFASAGTARRTAVANASPAWTSNTPSGQAGDYALNFTPGTQVVVNDPLTKVRLDTNSPSFTLQAWVNFKGNPSGRQVLYYNQGPGGALSFSVDTNRTVFVTTLGKLDRNSNAKIPDDGGWHHIAAVNEDAKKEIRFYVDGALADTKAYTNGVSFTFTNRVFFIGSEPNNNLQYTGMLDRLMLSKGVLTPEQFDFPAGAMPPSLVSVGALEGAIGVVFDKAVSIGTATNVANYTVTGATVTSATLVSPNYVLLGVSAVPTNAFSVTVNGVASTLGDVMTTPGTVEAAAAGATIPTGLTAYWSFDGHLLDSIDGFDGAARGKVPVGFVDGVSGFGKALKLTGTNYVEIPGSSNTLQFANGSLSIAGWFKVDAFDKSWQALIAKGEDATPGNYRVARRSDGVITGDTSIAYAGGTGEGAADTPPVNDGKWHHFVAITDATAAKFGTALYIDGVIHSINTNKPVLKAGDKNLLIGENPEALNRQWVGEIDDIGLWNRVLAPEEISMLYNGGEGTPVSTLPGVNTPVPANRPYTIGLNFAADEYSGGKQGTLAPSDVAGALPQANWNNLTGPNGTNVANIVADTDFEASAPTSVAVSWVSNGTWSSTGRGEENNLLTGADRTLMLGYLDTGNATTSSVTITNIPTELTSSGYDVYVYAMGGVGGRGGGYRILDAATKAVLKNYVRVVSPTNSTTFIEAPTDSASTNYAAGNYMVFMDLTAPAITIEGTTEQGYGFSGTPRAPINAVQLVAVAPAETLISIGFGPDGLVITFTGTLQQADSITGPWTDVQDAKSPMTVTPTGGAKFYRVQQ